MVSAEYARQTAEAASFRLLVYAYVRDYIGLMSEGPSLGEVANKFETNRDRVKRAIDHLVKEGLLIRVPGPRGLRLPSMRDEAIRQLRMLGYVVDEDIGRILPPPGSIPLTKLPLLNTPALDYQPDPEGIDGEQAGEGAGQGASRAA